MKLFIIIIITSAEQLSDFTQPLFIKCHTLWHVDNNKIPQKMIQINTKKKYSCKILEIIQVKGFMKWNVQ